jgi:tetratricopeptide (TPR) repeat protein
MIRMQESLQMEPYRGLLFMKRNTIVVFLISFFLMSCSSIYQNAIADTHQQIDPYNHLLKHGIEKAFNMEDQAATDAFQKVIEIDRNNPIGYAFLALVHLFFYEMSFDPKEREKNQEAMLGYVTEAVTKGENRITKNAQDDQAYFAMALAKMAKVRWAILHKRYFLITTETMDVWHNIEKAEKENPKYFDYHFPIGLLLYHLDHIQGVTRFFSSLLITPGDRKKGLAELELVAKNGFLLKDLAKAELSAVYLNFEKEPARALSYLKELKEKFPGNYNFSFALAITLSDLHRFDEAFAIAGGIESAIRAGTPPFVPQLQPRYDQLMGKIFFDQGRYTQASEYFHKSLKDLSPYNARVRAWALVRLGMIHDIDRERKQAIDYYSKSLEVEGGEGTAQVEAKRYLKSPYVSLYKP